ncbi:TolC family protein [Microcoleus sp. FACHB-SPT15]|uniref:TolC family protein n=1 Tax=Microcoleus sp. FACHB-SPT15 TaxID=2692830 RepID=UPI0017815C97|nr:TolC family protein [Microcoleus sp. FACHB-SPT15]MBD1805752.1 TolC family protein [Microcoleus sp. FACHB-SPT15]
MPSVRHFVALGIGAAIALSYIEPGASKDFPLISKPQRHRAQSQDANPEVVPHQGRLVASSQDSQEVERRGSKKAGGEDEPKQSVVIPDDEVPTEADTPESNLAPNNLDNPVTNSDEGDQRGEVGEAREESISVNKLQIPEWVRDEEEKSASVSQASATLTEQEESDRVSEAEPLGSALLPADRLGENTANNPDVSEPSQDIVAPTIVQSPASDIAQSPPGNQGSAPEFLNPSANPLLFPTEAEEVQVQITQPITLQQALELAQRNNRDLREARLTLERSQFQLQEALAAEYPTATFGADFTRSDSAQRELGIEAQADNPLAPDDDDTISTTFNGTVELSYDLLTAGRRSANIRAAREQVRFQQLDVERIFQQLRLDTIRSYYDLQEADAQVEISQAAVTDAARSLRDAQLQEQAGLGTRFDVLQAQVQLANENQGLIRGVSQQRIRRRQLTQLLSLAQPVEVSAADPIEVAGDWELSLEQSIILALKNRAELEQQLVNRNISQQQRRAALAAIRPQASVFASYNILGVLDDDFGPADGLSLGARLQWNFFDGGAARARARSEETEIAIAENRFADQRNQVRLEVEQAFFELSANEENIQTASFALEQAQESLRLARLRFQAGVGTQADVITQQTQLTRARVNRLNAILDYNRALAALQRAISNLPDSNLFDLP